MASKHSTTGGLIIGIKCFGKPATFHCSYSLNTLLGSPARVSRTGQSYYKFYYLAACLLGGQSTHSALVLNIKGSLVVDDRHRHAWSRIVLVLIDETSMMSIQTLGDGANQLKLLGDSRKLLGGIGVVLCC